MNWCKCYGNAVGFPRDMVLIWPSSRSSTSYPNDVTAVHADGNRLVCCMLHSQIHGLCSCTIQLSRMTAKTTQRLKRIRQRVFLTGSLLLECLPMRSCFAIIMVLLVLHRADIHNIVPGKYNSWKRIRNRQKIDKVQSSIDAGVSLADDRPGEESFSRLQLNIE
jgi:hypothetical protein